MRDAKKDYKIAESLVSDKINLVSFYLAEINLARTLGELNQYSEANYHFTSAIQSIDFEGEE